MADGHPLAPPGFRVVVPDGMMMHGSVVPEYECVRLPLHATVEPGVGLDMLVEHGQERIAFRPTNFIDVPSEGLIDE